MDYETEESPSVVGAPVIEALPRSELERRCLSALAIDPNDVLNAVTAGLTSDDFASQQCGMTFAMMVGIVSSGSKVDPGQEVSLQCLKLGEKAPFKVPEWLTIQALEPTSSRARSHVEQVLAYSKRDKLLHYLKTAYHAVNAHKVPEWNLCLEDAQKSLGKINDLSSDSAGRTLAEIGDSYIADQLDPFKARVTPIGIADWDRGAGSLREGELVTLAARPGMGKTALAIQTANAVISRGGVVAFFSLEMPGEELFGRLAVHRAGRDGLGVHDRERDKRIDEAKNLKKADKQLYIYEERSSRTLAAIEARCRLHFASKAGINLIVIDYIQLIQSSQEMRRAPREQQVAEITRRLKLLANEVKCPILMLAQLNRDSEKESRAPRLSDLRESGAIEQDSDRVWFLFSPPADKDTASPGPADDDAQTVTVRLLQAKCRGGRPWVHADLQYDRPIHQFTKLTSATAERV